MATSIYSLLSLFALLTISSGTFFLSKKIKIPYTVLLVVIGLLLVPLSFTSAFSFIKEFSLTPSLLFYVFLPILIFESAYNISIRKLTENIRSISLLSILSLILSAFFIAAVLYFAFHLLGIEIPFIVTLLFGSLISATDPVAVLALFKDFGAPRRLALIFEGESLFNDGTAVALFLIVLEVAITGFHGFTSIGEGVIMFSIAVFGGIIFGLFMGGLFSKIIQHTKSNEFIGITLTMIMAHLTFILSEIMSENLIVFGQEIKLSSIVATTIASMVIGNYGRYKMSLKSEEFIEKFWGQFAFIANSLVFILIGLLFANLNISIMSFILPIVVTVLVVAAGRAFSVYPVIWLVNYFKKEAHIPLSWQHLLSWGSLRGALAVTMVLLIPDNLTFSGWTHAFTPKEFIMTLTIGCIFATLFIKATTVSRFIKKLNLDELNDIEKIEYGESLILIYTKVLNRLSLSHEKGYIDESLYLKLKNIYESLLKEAYDNRKTTTGTDAGQQISDRVLRIHAIGIEKHFLKELFIYEEINEKVYKRILNKLTIQLENLESGVVKFDYSKEKDNKDAFEALADIARKLLSLKNKPGESTKGLYMYYRAQSIISRKVVKELMKISGNSEIKIFNEKSFEKIIDLYGKFKENSMKKMEAVATQNQEIISDLNKKIIQSGLLKTKELALNDLYKKEMVTPKLYITLKNKLESEA